jgi:hypothetical protein
LIYSFSLAREIPSRERLDLLPLFERGFSRTPTRREISIVFDPTVQVARVTILLLITNDSSFALDDIRIRYHRGAARRRGEYMRL